MIHVHDRNRQRLWEGDTVAYVKQPKLREVGGMWEGVYQINRVDLQISKVKSITSEMVTVPGNETDRDALRVTMTLENGDSQAVDVLPGGKDILNCVKLAGSVAASISDDPLHEWFSLSYSSYFVLPRSILQSMPVEWQQRFRGLIEEFQAATRDLKDLPGDYYVKAKDANGQFIRDPYSDYERGRRRVPLNLEEPVNG